MRDVPGRDEKTKTRTGKISCLKAAPTGAKPKCVHRSCSIDNAPLPSVQKRKIKTRAVGFLRRRSFARAECCYLSRRIPPRRLIQKRRGHREVAGRAVGYL